MTTTVEKFVLESASEVFAGEFLLPADARIVYVKITNSFKPAFYAIVNDDVPKVLRKFVALPSRVAIPPGWVHCGSVCNGGMTFHLGEIVECLVEPN